MKTHFLDRVYFAIMLFLCLLTSCNKYETDRFSEGTGSILIYLIADNDLDVCVSMTIKSINEGVMQLPLDSEVLLYVDSYAEKPYLKKISRDLNGKLNETLISIYEEQISTSSSVMELVLTDMLNVSTYSRYGLVIWSHGNGWYPAFAQSYSRIKWVGLDGTNSMNINTLKNILYGMVHFDFILFDACYMGGIETFYELKDCVDYIIASPSSVMSYGFPYHKMIRFLQFGNEKDMIEACKQYIFFYNAIPEHYRYASICCVKCSELDSLASVVRNGLSETELISRDQLANYQTFDGPGQYMYFDFLDYYSSIMYDGGERLKYQIEKTVLFKGSTPQVLAMNPEIPVTISNKFCGMSAYIPRQDNIFLNYCFYQTAWYNSINYLK